ncbi:MAG: ERF family protein [Streptococcus agalactiae]|jgi:phage single-strand DNA-binding protein|nr:ERF family protein [Streptococcus agalactiae]DAF23956.1 MAG TPA: ERF superfamily protein [Caudoviricetes sp.]DAP94335.1 MAG TPA: ERF superfamily protein [Caudoviricetes sp.]DAT07490.1 MAG TPA: ERF superfamily protein [Bacteriophage sp.]
MKKSETLTEFSKAFAKTQQEMKQPLKDANNPFFKSKYVPLENVVEAITESASKNGLSFTQFPSSDEDGNVTVGTLVMHSSGEWIEYDPIKMKPVKNDPQSIGSAITYAKRYALSAIFGITSDQDDDGNEATQTKKQQPKKVNDPVISVEKANYYLKEIATISAEKGKEDGSIVKWFLNHLGVVDYKMIKQSQIEDADMLLGKLKGN